MSTLVSSFVKDRASAAQLPTASLISGAAKVWFSYNYVSAGETYFNITSIVDGGTGLTSVTFMAPFANALPATVVSSQDNQIASSGPYTAGMSTRSAGGMAVTGRQGPAAIDNGAFGAVFGDLA